jgi:mRNA interferase RelE/StbE
MPDIYFTERGQDRLEDLEPQTEDRIKSKLRDISDWPEHFLKPLSGRDDYVLRVGDYRVLIQWARNDDNDALYVKSLGHRRNFYDREI